MSAIIPHRESGEVAAVPSITCIGFTPSRSGSSVLRGHAELHLRHLRLRLHGCPVFYSATADSAWVGLPSREIGKDADGKPRFAAMMEWDTRDIQNAFSVAAVAAIDLYAGGAWREGGR